MNPIRLEDIPEEKIFDYFICNMCDRIIGYSDVETFSNCNIPVNGDVTILAQCKQCDNEIQNRLTKEFNQKRIKNMHYYFAEKKQNKSPQKCI